MPREVYDVEGNLVEGIPDEAELTALKADAQAKKDLDTKVAEAQGKLDAYEKDPAYKNFGLLRKAKLDAEIERDEWKTKFEGVAPKDEKKAITLEEVEKVADTISEKKYLERVTDGLLNQFGDKKDVVKKIYDKLTAGETLTEAQVLENVQTAANAAGLNRKVNPINQVIAVQGSGAPRFDDEKSFADTEEGKARAAAMGLNFNPPKK